MSRVLIVDDQPAVRFGLRMQLALVPDLLVVGEACNGEEAVQLARTLQPDLVLMDVKMPVMDGLAATERLLEQLPDCMVVILTIQDDCETRERARAAGAGAFVPKTEVDSLMVELRKVRSADSNRTGGNITKPMQIQ